MSEKEEIQALKEDLESYMGIANNYAVICLSLEKKIKPVQEKIELNTRAFRHKQTADIRYLLTEKDTEEDWEDVMIIPNLDNREVDNFLGSKFFKDSVNG